MNRFFYSALFYLAVPLLLVRLWWRGFKAPAYRQRWIERLGFVSTNPELKPLWIHAVSVGETMAIIPLVKLLQQNRPELKILITSMTPTGAACVQYTFGDQLNHLFCPWDLPCALNRFLNSVNPCGCIIVETELWPNLIHSCHQRNIPVALVNARLSARSAKGYARFAYLTSAMLKQLNFIATQNSETAERFIQLGAATEIVVITGSVKFDIKVPDNSEKLVTELVNSWGKLRPVWLAGSTHEGEENILLAVHQRLLSKLPNLLLVIVPRHPERFNSVAELIASKGLSFVRRSSSQLPDSKTEVYLGDTMGELTRLQAAANVVFVGGSLINRGGHNPLEAAILHKPVISGENFFNFQVIYEALQAAGGANVIRTESELESSLYSLLIDPEKAQEQGQAGYDFVIKNQGALARLYNLIEQQIIPS